MRRISLYKFYNLCSKTCNIFTIFQFNNTFFRKKKKKTDLIIPNWFNNTYNIFHIIISFSLLERPGLGGYEYCLVVQCEKDMETQKSIFFPSIFWGTQTSFTTRKTGYCSGPKPPLKPKKAPLKVPSTYCGGCFCGGPSRQCCNAAISRLQR